ncbi:uncharacterized protein LOC100846877 [Brachypodium distachyon]|uniref:Uncharacterized protein n=1 Tax=Brachypodium distachyon TaxID=15368 RepID=I1J118_BRADI|nr:uncharacterized protein LOC100846877 [Brachypodium distachyon]KQJ84253.1 hypothetical protein BRADI_5g19590v3 [Brachypodium distachyon]|eukprot:XP_003580406.1 uncharacterized protein LOC100846877 [Brachypodium distachyon]
MLSATTACLPLLLRRSPRPTPLSSSHDFQGLASPTHPRPRRRTLACRAELQQDAPFVAAMGACVLASLALPQPRIRGEAGEEEDEGGFGATDTRMGVMGIISFLPYFNWLSWVFAWLDSGRRLYLVYAAVYLAPYLRTNLSLSPDESWLPIASIFICILHVQLEAGIRSGDIEGFTFVEKAQKLLFPNPMKAKDGHRGKKRESLRTGHRSNTRIPSAHESREKLRNSDIFKRKLDEPNDEKQKKSDWH